MAKICVAVVAYRSDATIQRCLTALAAQTYRDFEVIVVNNGLTPSLTGMIIKNLPVRVVTQENLGFAGGNNFAVTLAAPDTQWLALLNPDAFPAPDWLESFAASLQNYPNVTMFGSLQRQALRSGWCDGIGDCYYIFGLAWRRGHGRKLPPHITDRECFSPCAAAGFYCLDAFRDVGGFDEDYFCYFEDVDLGFRLRLRGATCIQLANVIVDHVGGASTTSGSFAVQHAMRNIVWTYIKDMPSPFFWIFLPGMALTYLALLLRYILAGHGEAAWQGMYNALASLNTAWTKRKYIQSHRTVGAWSLMRPMTWLPIQPLRHLLRRIC